MSLMDGSTSGSDDIECRAELSAAERDLLSLPPMPRPDYCQMRAEASCGNSLVLFLIFLFVAPMQSYASANNGKLTFVQQMWMFAIYLEAAIAIVCLLGLMWGDPGTIKRTPANCFPQPEIVAQKLRNGESLANVGNIADDGRVFCIRCLVWRADDGMTHHCSTCQRCVEDFDHHCGVRSKLSNFPSLVTPCPRHPMYGAASRCRVAHARCRVLWPITGVRPMHRRRGNGGQHGLLQNSHPHGRPRLCHVRHLHGRLCSRGRASAHLRATWYLPQSGSRMSGWRRS